MYAYLCRRQPILIVSLICRLQLRIITYDMAHLRFLFTPKVRAERKNAIVSHCRGPTWQWQQHSRCAVDWGFRDGARIVPNAHERRALYWRTTAFFVRRHMQSSMAELSN